MEEMGNRHYNNIKNSLKKKQKVKLAFELLQGLQTIPDERLNGETKNLIDILFDLQSVMKRSEIEDFVKHILRMLKDTLSQEQNKKGLHYLSQFKNLKNLGSSVNE